MMRIVEPDSTLESNTFENTISEFTGLGVNLLFFIMVALVLWELVWKASKHDHLVWFILIFVLNTVGILLILYNIVYFI